MTPEEKKGEIVCQNCGSVWAVALATDDAEVKAELRGCPICVEP
jgi:transcription initiation factor TFIIIB Brf1 subunit/transcription initiation factor TFIIB